MRKYIFMIILFPFLISCLNNNEKKIEHALISQLEKYPESALQDIYKNFYQDRFGTEHAISDVESVRQYLEYELENMESSNTPMIEPLGWEQNFVRVDLQLVRDNKISENELLEAFVESASVVDVNVINNWPEEWGTIVKLIEKNKLQIRDFEKDKETIDSLLKINPKIALHHSESFRQHYKPHYRVVEKSIYERLEN